MRRILGGGLVRNALSLLVTLAMVLGLCPAVGLAEELEAEPEGGEGNALVVQGGGEVEPDDGLVAQDGEVEYIDADGSTPTCDEYTSVEDSDIDETWTDGWYVVSGEKLIKGRITVSGAVHLILCDGATLTAKHRFVHQDVHQFLWQVIYGQHACQDG